MQYSDVTAYRIIIQNYFLAFNPSAREQRGQLFFLTSLLLIPCVFALVSFLVKHL
ncbi:MAG: hypothetical protein UR91_C0001G0037, partial [Candidatus Nomurabacteria bacterium GW2011_GWC2_35_8]